jgi:glycosyltransferase involved in cell wall biosynthesis
MTTTIPLITCICITGRRIVKLKKAIKYFKEQDYPNKELLISYPRSDRMTNHVLDKMLAESKFRIIKVERDDRITLGDARNHAISRSNGNYLCTWDDDDWYHKSRLSLQLHYLIESGDSYKAAILNQLVLFDRITKKAYLSFLYPWENTLLCKREVFENYHYRAKDRGEDSDIIDLLNADKALLHITGLPFLYIYIYHSQNTWGYYHFKSFLKRSKMLGMNICEKIATITF